MWYVESIHVLSAINKYIDIHMYSICGSPSWLRQLPGAVGIAMGTMRSFQQQLFSSRNIQPIKSNLAPISVYPDSYVLLAAVVVLKGMGADLETSPNTVSFKQNLCMMLSCAQSHSIRICLTVPRSEGLSRSYVEESLWWYCTGGLCSIARHGGQACGIIVRAKRMR